MKVQSFFRLVHKNGFTFLIISTLIICLVLSIFNLFPFIHAKSATAIFFAYIYSDCFIAEQRRFIAKNGEPTKDLRVRDLYYGDPRVMIPATGTFILAFLAVVLY